MEKNLLLTIEYDGSGFSGWQRQPGSRTVQGTLEEVLSKFCGVEVTISGTSRTDAGVHALGQRATLRGNFSIPTDKLKFAVNNYLAGGMNAMNPVGEIYIREIEDMPEGFHARFDCKGKMYRYIIRNCETPDVFRKKYSYFVRKPLDIERMNRAAQHIIGTHDFECFQAAGAQKRETTVRTVHSLDVRREGENVILEIAGDGFLYNMVRIITGTLVEVGLGKKEPDDLKAIIESRERTMAGHTAPAAGLYLAEVYY